MTEEDERAGVFPLTYPHVSWVLGSIKQRECPWISKCDRAEGVIEERNKGNAYFNNTIMFF